MTATGAILGIMLTTARRVPSALSGTAQGLNAVLFGAGLVLTTAGSGYPLDRGAATGYGALAAMAALALIVARPATRFTIDAGG